MNDPFYQSRTWRRLRAARLRMDRGVCVVPGCGKKASTVDHVVARRAGGPDTLGNLRSLCRDHDHAVKELPNGKRRNDGKLVVKGAFSDGSPRDPRHPWYTGGPGRGGSHNG